MRTRQLAGVATTTGLLLAAAAALETCVSIEGTR
jgi:hypothetical protein